MTKKHFEAFAAWIRLEMGGMNDEGSLHARMEAASMVAAIAARDNPRFDRERFMKACGL